MKWFREKVDEKRQSCEVNDIIKLLIIKKTEVKVASTLENLLNEKDFHIKTVSQIC